MKKKARFGAPIMVCAMFLATAVAADPLATFDEDMTAAWTLQTCAADASDIFKKYPPSEAQLKAMGDAAWHQLWDTLDKEDAAHHEENARKADFELKKRMEADFKHASALVAAQGCDALVPHARWVVENSFK